MEERARRRAARSQDPAEGRTRARARDSSGPSSREAGRSPREGHAGVRDSSDPFSKKGNRGRSPRKGSARGREPSDPVPAGGGRGPEEGRPRDSSDPHPRAGDRGPGESRPAARHPVGSFREVGRTGARNEPSSRVSGSVPGAGRAGALGDPPFREGWRAPVGGRAETTGEPLSKAGGYAGAPTESLFREGARTPRDGSRAPESGRPGAPSDPLPGEGSRTPGVGHRVSRPMEPPEHFHGEGERPPGAGPAGERGDSPPGPQLDVSSDRFDPLLVLYSPKVPLPFPEVRAFNNLAEYESFQRRGGVPRARATGTVKTRKGKKPPPDPERVQRLKNLIVCEDTKPRPPRKGHRGPKNVLTRMPLNDGSPLGELHRCVKDRVKVNIHVRTYKGLRGVCSGFLVAFDKFWNMALTDVDETYRKPVLGKAFYHEPQLTLTRLFDRLKLQESCRTTAGESTEPQASKSSTSKAEKDQDGTVPGRYDTARRSSRRQGTRNKDEELYTLPEKPTISTPLVKQSESKSSTAVKGQTLTRPHRPKVDYQKVHTRHINQMFIRGENILLVHLAK
ncbi:U7 snRNA-associated Sm-like protein LSm11 [Lissotriton helveticus]